MNGSRALRSLTLTPDGRAGGWRVAREEGPDPAMALIGRTPEEAAQEAGAATGAHPRPVPAGPLSRRAMLLGPMAGGRAETVATPIELP